MATDMRECHIVAKIKPTTDRVGIYRLYVDTDLITERTFIWGQNSYLKENIFVKLKTGIHRINIQTVPIDYDFGAVGDMFKLEDIIIDGVPVFMHQNYFRIQ